MASTTKQLIEGTIGIQDFVAQFASREADAPAFAEIALRKGLRSILIESHNIEACLRIVDYSIEGTKLNLLLKTTPHTLLEDLFDVITVSECETAFGFLEEHVGTWTKEPFSGSTSFPRFLRICNALKKRLSKSKHTVFCGRILIFLASIIPLTDKSGVNLSSSFNSSNTTAYVTEESLLPPESGVPLDFAFYRKLWQLQSYCCSPNLVYSKHHWGNFTQCVDAVLTVFKACASEPVTPSDGGEGEGGVYIAKYLTSPALLHLQLADYRFRRQVLLQIVIVLNYLNTPTKFKRDLTLTPFQTEWIAATMSNTHQIIRETPPDGAAFLKTVQHILQREESWVVWKNDGCPNFERAPLKRSEATESQAPAPKRRGNAMGSATLSELWSTANNAEDTPFEPPQLEEFFREAAMQLDPANEVEEEYWSINDDVFAWRALRLIARTRIDLLQDAPTLTNPPKTMPEYLKATIQTVVPTETPAPTTTTTATATTTADGDVNQNEANQNEVNQNEANQNDEGTTAATSPSQTPAATQS